MKSILRHPAPNIVPGLNLTAARFEEIYAWVSALAADSVQAALSPYQYGLLLPFDGKESLSLEKIEHKLVLTRCLGLTPQGTVVAWLEEHPPLILDLASLDLSPHEPYQIVLEVRHHPRHPFGPDADDLPSRPLYAMPSCTMRVQPAGQPLPARPDAFCIGRLVLENGAWRLADYIPPCVHLGAHAGLRQRYRKYCEAIDLLLEVQPEVIRQTDSFQEKSMIELREFTLQLGSLLAGRRHRYAHLTETGNPYDLFAPWAEFAQLASFLLQCLTDRPGFFNLLNENTRGVNGVFLTPQVLDAAIRNLAGLAYDHQVIGQAVEITDQFLDLIIPIFKALALSALRPVQNKGSWAVEPLPEMPQKKYFTW